MNEVVIDRVVDTVETWNPRREDTGSFTYVDLSSVDRDLKAVSGPSTVDVSEAPSRARQLIATGDVLVSTVRPNLNAVACVGPDLDGATASTGFCVLRPRSDEIDGKYLFHWVRTPRFVGQLVQRATGASYPAVTDKIVKASSVPLPPLEEQRRIAAVLNAAEALRAKRHEAISKLGTLMQAIFADMFGAALAEEPEWAVDSLADVVEQGTTVTYGIVQAGDEVPGGVPYLRSCDIVDGRVCTDGLRHTDPAIADAFPRSRIRSGEVVMSIRATVGPVAMVPDELDGANLARAIARIAPGARVDGTYLLAYLQAPEAQRWIQRQVKGATFREITLKRLRELPVLVPPLSLQREFAARGREVESLRSALDKSLMQFDQLFASLQQRAFRGEL